MKRTLGILGIAVCWFSSFGTSEELDVGRQPALWSAPLSIQDRDLVYGQGGPDHAPMAGPFVFEKEDEDGKSPKFVVRDANGLKWKVKVGAEAKPETVATRLVWAVGYLVDEDYFLPAMQVESMPPKLSRGGEFVSADGVVRNARWERMEHKKAAVWKWSDNPFSDTRELNGLRVLMALLNNWDVKPQQNAVYDATDSRQYVVSDLGSTFGPTGTHWPIHTTRGDLKRYSDSDFINKVTDEYVDFASPSWPMLFGVVPVLPLPYAALTAHLSFLGIPPAVSPMSSRWVGKRVPRKDVVWIAGLLEQLTPEQIRQAFQSANYSADEVEGFSKVVEARIHKLAALTQ